MKILTERRYFLTTTAEREIGRDVKKKFCYIACDYDTELKLTALDPPTMKIKVVVRFSLQPNFIGEGASEIHDNSSSSNMKIDVYIRKELYTSGSRPCSKGLVSHDEQIDVFGSIHDEFPSGCSTRVKCSVWTFKLSADVDLEGRVR